MPLEIKQEYSLSQLNSFALPSTAAFYVAIENHGQLEPALAFAAQHKLPYLVLGAGSNMLLPPRYAGLVLHMQISGSERVFEDDNVVHLQIGSGENWHQLVMSCLNMQLYGLENLALIPGTVGAAPIQNIGAYGVELKDSLVSVRGFNSETINTVVMDNKSCAFGYRDSVFKQAESNKVIISSVTLCLHKTANINISYKGLAEALAMNSLAEDTVKSSLGSMTTPGSNPT
ncbi:MAG: UDP-N-acetylenolpyruvoylglucosamine reductase, partial [SAR86 cluster bacterium]